jgi:hypothetical protein
MSKPRSRAYATRATEAIAARVERRLGPRVTNGGPSSWQWRASVCAERLGTLPSSDSGSGVPLAASVRETAGGELTEPVDRDYGTRERTVTDPDGSRWALSTYPGTGGAD